MVVADYFAKWTEAYPILNQIAETVARVCLDEFICSFESPEIVHADQGKNFEYELFKELFEMLGKLKTRTTPFRPQSDDMVERFKYPQSYQAGEEQRTWDAELPRIMMAYSASRHESSKHTPNMLLAFHQVYRSHRQVNM